MVHSLVMSTGSRPHMEDFAAYHNTPAYAVYAVFDGHGGDEIARICAENIVRLVHKHFNPRDEMFLYSVFADLDALVPKRADMDNVGSTATVVVVTDDNIFCANAGDSEAFMYTRIGHTAKCLPITRNHKVDNERQRLEDMDALITQFPNDTPRLFGMLNLARSIGDRYLSPFVVWAPFITRIPRKQSPGMVVVATDGLWDTVDPEELVDGLAVKGEHALTAWTLAKANLARKRGSGDNLCMFAITV